MTPSDVPDREGEVWVERIWTAVDELPEIDPTDVRGRLVEHDGVWWYKGYLSYHGEDYHAWDGDERMPREKAERLGADPCPACYPDDERNEWAQVSQSPTEEGGTMTAITPKPPDGEDDTDEFVTPSDELQREGEDKAEEYHATARALYADYSPDDPEAGPPRSEAEFHEYLRERGATIREDPDGTTHHSDIPEHVATLRAALARELETPLYEQFGFDEPPDPP